MGWAADDAAVDEVDGGGCGGEGGGDGADGLWGDGVEVKIVEWVGGLRPRVGGVG